MSRLLSSLTPDQEIAVAYTGRKAMLVAPAGSGKTAVLTHRVVRLLRDTASKTFRILALTYSERASDELTKRVQTAVGEDVWRVQSDTIHGFALKWLRRYGASVGVAPDVVVYADNTDRLLLLAEVAQTMGRRAALNADLNGSLGPVLNFLDHHRTVHRGDCSSSCGNVLFLDRHEPAQSVRELYDNTLRAAGALDFAGMLSRFRDLLLVDPWVKRQFQRIYRHLLVDEGQDLTPIQAELIDLLVGEDVNLFVVADETQSINAWAGGGFRHALDLMGNEYKRLSLFTNFRCAGNILEHAGRLAAHIKSHVLDVDAVVGAPPGKVLAVKVTDEQSEADRIVMWVEEVLSGLDPTTLSDGEDPLVLSDEIGIVSRVGWSLRRIGDALTDAGYPVAIEQDERLFFVNLTACIFVSQIARQANQRDDFVSRRLDEYISDFRNGPEGEGGGGLEISDVLTRLSELARAAMEPGKLGRSIDQLVRERNDLLCPDGALVIRNEYEAYSALMRAAEVDARGFLLRLGSQQRARLVRPGIRLLTAHRAKGLEFKAVAIIGAYEDGFPHYRSMGCPEKLDHERKAFYVAMTRASRYLLITWPRRTVDQWGRPWLREPSRFLKEAGIG